MEMIIRDIKNGFNFRSDEKGNWFWKAVIPKKIKKKVSETPQLKVVEDIEKIHKKEFDKSLSNLSRDIIRYLV